MSATTALDDTISCIAASHLIQAECAVVLQKSGDVYLANEEVSSSSGLRVASNIQPLRLSEHSSWRSIKFGTQPRQFIYADATQLLAVDARAHSQQRRLFQADTAEVIQGNQVCHNDYFYHLICGSSSVTVLDERFASRPLLKWNHWLRSECTLMKSINLFKHY